MVNAEERPKVSSIMASPVPHKAGGKGEGHGPADADQGPSRQSDDNAPHILVVDDDSRIRDLLARYLQDNGFRVTTAVDAASARASMRSLAFDLFILMDDAAENGAGLRPVARAIASADPDAHRACRARPAHRGLETGVDDYLAKPFDPRELLLRVSNVLRRGGRRTRAARCAWASSSSTSRAASSGGREETDPFHRARARAAALFRPAGGTPVSRHEPAKGEDGGGERAVDVQINRRRRKISATRDPVYLPTVSGKGYILYPE